MVYSKTPRKETLRSIVDASQVPFWLDDPSRSAPEPELTENRRAELLVIGAGFTGLWTALLAKEENPSRDIVILEAGQVATGATGRNGGFMDASITHGFYNGLSRWPKELPTFYLPITNTHTELPSFPILKSWSADWPIISWSSALSIRQSSGCFSIIAA